MHNVFVNTMTQKAVVSQLLPLETVDKDELQERWDYIYEPDSVEILDGILMRYVESQVFQGAVENVACEMAARMVAMKSASDNAGDLIEEFQLIYNKARQAAITKELEMLVVRGMRLEKSILIGAQRRIKPAAQQPRGTVTGAAGQEGFFNRRAAPLMYGVAQQPR